MERNVEYSLLEPNDLHANDWNPNVMTDSVRDHLLDEINRIGFLAPVIVRKEGKKLIIIDGEHRWQVAKELKLKKIPVIITDLTEDEAKIQTVNLNQIKGEFNPIKYAELLEALGKKYKTEELQAYLRITADQLASYSEILNAPNREVKLVSFVAEEKDMPLLLSIIIPAKDRVIVEQAFKATEAKTHSLAVVKLAQSYLKK